MIKSANEMRELTIKNEMYEKGFKRAVDHVIESIQRASKLGLRKTSFCPTTYTDESGYTIFFDDEVKELFKKYGYKFKPTGYINGVWQETEDICW